MRLLVLRSVQVVAALIVLAAILGYAAAAARWEWRWVHENRTEDGGWTPNSGHKPPVTWLVVGQGCIEAGFQPCPPYIFGMFSVNLPWDLPEPRFVWTPAVHTYSMSNGGGAWVRMPLWLLLIPAAPVAGHALAGAVRTLRTRTGPGACPRCHYDRAGIASDAVCPECGTLPQST